jgi:hypothetical protein
MTYHSEKITVKTHPNGYELNIDQETFFYHNIEDFVAGFIVRVGLKCKDPMMVDDLHNIVLAIGAKHNVKSLLEEGRQLSSMKDVEEQKKTKTKKDIPNLSPSHPDILQPPATRLAEILRTPLRNIPMGKRITNLFLNAISAYRGEEVKMDDLTLADVAKLSPDEVVNAKGCGGATYYELVRLMSIYHISFGMDVDTIMESDV